MHRSSPILSHEICLSTSRSTSRRGALTTPLSLSLVKTVRHSLPRNPPRQEAPLSWRGTGKLELGCLLASLWLELTPGLPSIESLFPVETNRGREPPIISARTFIHRQVFHEHEFPCLWGETLSAVLGVPSCFLEELAAARMASVPNKHSERSRGPVWPDAAVHWMGHSLTLTFPPTRVSRRFTSSALRGCNDLRFRHFRIPRLLCAFFARLVVRFSRGLLILESLKDWREIDELLTSPF